MRLTALALIALATVGASLIGGQVMTRPDARAVSDHFWDHFRVTGSPVEHYEALADLAAGSETVILGRVSDIRPGRTFGSVESGFVHYVSATIAVDEVVASSREVHDTVVLELMIGGDGQPITLQPHEVPTEQVLLFLRNKGSEAKSFGWSVEAQLEEAQYFRRVVSEGVFRSLNGVASPLTESEHPYAREWEGRRFADLVAVVRAALRAGDT